MADYVDLHIHTYHSDGRQTSDEVVAQALKLELKAISITDHDTVLGIPEAESCAAGTGLEVVSGIELSTTVDDRDLHMLGYLFDPENKQLLDAIRHFREVRETRGQRMLEKLTELDMPIEIEEVRAAAGEAAIGRPHIAQVMLEKKYVHTYNEAFRRYIGTNGPAYVPKANLSPQEAIDLIHEAGGVAVMAHPALTAYDEYIPTLKEQGMDGIEIYHPTHNRSDRQRYRKLGKKLDLFFIGGSDSHNRKGRYGDIGDQRVPYHYLDDMKDYWQKRLCA
jgi:hypothetical protein